MRKTDTMNIPLPGFEIDILNKVIHTRTFGEFSELKTALQKLVEEEKENLISSRKIAPDDFPLHKTRVVNNMIQFLVRNEFYGVRDGSVYFLTERGKHLQKQGSIQKYLEWESEREEKIISELHTIEEKGYLDKNQTYKNDPQPVDEEEKKIHFEYYLIIIIAIIILAALGKTNKWW